MEEAPIMEEASEVAQQIKEQGGITIDLGAEQPSEGLAFSPFKEVETKVPADEFSKKHIVNFINENIDRLRRDDHFLGAWYDEEDGNIYLDISKVGTPSTDTLVEGWEQEQLSVFDLKNFVEIKTPYYYEDTHNIQINKREDARRISRRIYEGYQKFLREKEAGREAEIEAKREEERREQKEEELKKESRQFKNAGINSLSKKVRLDLSILKQDCT